MKHIKLFFGLCCLFSLSGCFWMDNEEPPETPNNFTAVIVDRETFENSVQIFAPRAVERSGKIYIKENFLFINEVNKGFHVYVYSNPQTPVPVAFIQLLGATDLAARSNTLYINQAVDLVTLRYNSTSNTIEVTERNENVFPQKPSPDFSYADPSENEIIIDWIPE